MLESLQPGPLEVVADERRLRSAGRGSGRCCRGNVSHLRKALGVLVTRGGGYVLTAEPLDAERFATLVADGQRLCHMICVGSG